MKKFLVNILFLLPVFTIKVPSANFLSSGGTSTVDLVCVFVYLFVCLSCPSALNFYSPNLYLGSLLLFLLFVRIMVRYPCSYFCRFCYCEGRRLDWYMSPEQAANCIGLKLLYKSCGKHPELSTTVLCLSYMV